MLKHSILGGIEIRIRERNEAKALGLGGMAADVSDGRNIAGPLAFRSRN